MPWKKILIVLLLVVLFVPTSMTALASTQFAPGGLVGQNTSVEYLFAPSVVYLPLVVKSYPLTYSISGNLTYGNNDLANHEVALDTGQTTTTNINGEYEFDGLAAGTYTVAPAAVGYTFSPPSRVVSLPPDASNQDFAAVVPSTVTPTPTRTPTPTTTPGVTCFNWIVNGGFEPPFVAWIIPSTTRPALYVDSPVLAGSWAMRTGIVNVLQNEPGFSWVYQDVTIPTNIQSARLRFWLYPQSSAAPSEGDMQYAMIMDQNSNLLEYLVNQRLNTQVWTFYDFGIKKYAGQPIRIAFRSYNDGMGGVTSLFVDEVSLEICR